MNDNTNSIAINGWAGRFPGAPNISAFWNNLVAGTESITRFSNEELRTAGVPQADLENPNYVKARGILNDIDLFDADFFGYNPREAELIDPQQRIFLECAWQALENSGYDVTTSPISIGVFAGCGVNSYLDNILSHPEFATPNRRFEVMLGNSSDFLCTRISYKLNLCGPSINIQSACSTSLLAIHTACENLLNGACDMALAGGISVQAQQLSGYIYVPGGIASPDGHCRTFDTKANGTVPGNGVGIVVLKRLSDALADGDTIYSLIKGSSCNNDGERKVGYTAPSVEGQAFAIATAQAIAGVTADTVGYIEAHGTGTHLGDLIEFAALNEVFNSSQQHNAKCALGSVKTNVGHLDTAAGVAGLIKTALTLHHAQIVPSINFSTLNTNIPQKNNSFFINTSLTPFSKEINHRRAGVSSFGIGGTNVHIVLEEFPQGDTIKVSPDCSLLILSAKTKTSLDIMSNNLVQHLEQSENTDIADVAYTLQVGRAAFPYRRMLTCSSSRNAATKLRTHEGVFSGHPQTTYRSIAFMFQAKALNI